MLRDLNTLKVFTGIQQQSAKKIATDEPVNKIKACWCAGIAVYTRLIYIIANLQKQALQMILRNKNETTNKGNQ